jgi:exopolysaccharide biosynthesis protein
MLVKHPLTLFVLLVATSSITFSQLTYDTVRTMTVAPGMIYTHYTTGSVPWVMDVLQIDLKDPYLKLESAKAQDRYVGLERTSSMAARKTTPGHRVVGAINADFFDMANGQPINIQIAGGEIVRGPQALSTIGFTDANRVVMDRIGLTGIVKNGAAQSAITDVNQVRSTDFLILYNSFQGTTTGTNPWGTEVLVRPLTAWMVNDTVVCVVDSIASGVGNMTIPKGAAVLSGHGTSDAFLKASMHKNDTVKIFMKVLPGPARIKEMLGGYPRIIKNGADYVDQGYTEEGGPDHTYQRHNRTAIGLSADSSKLFFVTIDGRTTASLGMTLKEVSAFMLAIGVYQGINFDGGGSTTMVINNKIVNNPTDGSGERLVANAMLAVTTAPIDTLAKAELTTKKLRIFRGESFAFAANGWDKYGNILTLETANCSYAVAPKLGTVTSAGVYRAGVQPDSGWIYFVWKNKKIDSAYVVIKGVSRLVMSPKNIATDSIRTIQYKVVSYDTENILHTFGTNEYTWNVVNPAVASIDTSGLLKGKSNGTTQVIASYGSSSDTAAITIQIGAGSAVLDSMENFSSWKISGLNIDTAAIKASLVTDNAALGKYGFKIDYSFTYTGSTQTFLFLENEMPIFGAPDSFYLDLRSDSAAHRVSVLVTDDNGEQFRYYTNRYSLKIPEFDHLSINAATPSIVSSGTTFNYPIRLKRIEIQLGSSRVANTKYAGTLYLDNFRVSYPSQTPTSVIAEQPPRSFEIRQNYPNPFNPSTRIEFTVREAGNVSVRVFDILGKEIATLVNERMQPGLYAVSWNAKDHPSGVYFYQVRTNSAVATRRMMLLK